MDKKLRKLLETEPIEASAPCRIDMGGTLDIPTFYYPLRHLSPARLISLWGFEHGFVCCLIPESVIKISSRGFKDAQFPADAAPFDHPLGLMFATAAYFNAEGVHIDIESQSPPRSALGGSSAAAVALIAAFLKLEEQTGSDSGLNRRRIALLAYQLEQSTSGVAVWLSRSACRCLWRCKCLVLADRSRSIRVSTEYRYREKIAQRTGGASSSGLLWETA